MHRYTFYPTPPSTNEDSPQSMLLSSPSNISDNSSSPVHHGQSQVVFIPAEYSIPSHFSVQKNIPHTNESPIFLNIVEQPVDKFRFRYKSEMTGTHGNLNGEKSDKSRKMTYPTVEICNYQGPAIIRCSIWQINHENSDFMPHAHRLVKKRHGKDETDDPHDVKVDKDTNYQATFHSMGIIHTAKKNIVGELIKKKTRLKREEVARYGRKDLNKKEEMEIKGLAEAESKSINLNVICLRFDAFYVDDNDVYLRLCDPVFSHAINNLKSALTGELKIVRMDHCTSPACGEREIFLLVERVTKKNIKVRFYELDNDDNTIWEDFGRFSDLDVHHQYAIVLRTPPYRVRDISTQVKVCMELVRPSDNARSEPKEFTYTPSLEYSKPGVKRARLNDYDSGDYDSTSIGSEVLPTVIQNMSGEFESMMNLDEVNSEELKKAISDINSDEFQRLFETCRTEYEPSLLPGSENFSTDFPIMRSNMYRNTLNSNDIKVIKCEKDDEIKIQRLYKETTSFLKTSPDLDAIKKFLRHHLVNCKDQLNAFHLAVMNNQTKLIRLLVRLVTYTDEYDIVNVPSLKGLGSVLHLATLCNNLELVKTLVSTCHADVSIKDDNLNTPIHIAAEKESKLSLLEVLLGAENVLASINSQNKNSNTPLHRAVKRKNLKAAQLLCKFGANVDCRHPSNGYTALRFAIDNEDVPMVKFLLLEVGANPSVKDYKDVDPLQVALYNSGSTEIKNEVERYMSLHHISFDMVQVKEEIEDESSEDEMFICEGEVKAEPLPSTDDLQTLYQNVTDFTNECLNEVATRLDSSGKWEDLATLLDVEHLVPLFKETRESRSPAQLLLRSVVDTNSASIKEIRDFLESLDETAAVQAIDRMVQKSA